MSRRLLFQLPAWGQPAHPVLRYLLQRSRPPETRWRRLARLGLQAATVAIVVLLGYQVATGFGAQPARSLHAILYWPLVLLSVLVGLAALMLTGSAISLEKARGTWDSLRITSHGAGLVFQARWVSVFYTLRGPLGVLFLARLVFALAILIDLAQYFRGRYLDLLLSGITPTVSVPVGAALLAATMTAAILQPLVAVGLDAAVGLLVSVMVREPRYDILVRTALGPWMTTAGVWMAILFQSMVGDQGLRLLTLEESGPLWADVHYGILIGPALLVLTLFQAWLAGRMVGWAAHRAGQAD
jgi:hypothetical protein